MKKSFYLFQSTAEHNIEALKAQQLFFGFPSQFNDPSDCKVYLSDDLSDEVSDQGYAVSDLKKLFKEQYRLDENGIPRTKAYFISSELTKKIENFCDGNIFSSDLIKDIEQYFTNSIGVRCLFSDEPTSILMWAHYANQHQGFCIELEKVSSNRLPPMGVVYSTMPAYIYLSEFLFSPRNTINTVLFHKHSCWSYENEWRLCDYNYKNYKSTEKGFLVPVVDAGFKIKSVILGYRMSEADKQRVIDAGTKVGAAIRKVVPFEYTYKNDKVSIEENKFLIESSQWTID